MKKQTRGVRFLSGKTTDCWTHPFSIRSQNDESGEAARPHRKRGSLPNFLAGGMPRTAGHTIGSPKSWLTGTHRQVSNGKFTLEGPYNQRPGGPFWGILKVKDLPSPPLEVGAHRACSQTRTRGKQSNIISPPPPPKMGVGQK